MLNSLKTSKNMEMSLRFENKTENKVFDRWSILLTLVFISILFENLSLFKIGGASFKLYHIVAIIGIIIALIDQVSITLNSIILYIIFILLPWLPLYRINDLKGFFNTYIIYLLFSTFVLLCYRELRKVFVKNIYYCCKMCKITCGIIVIYGILQFVFDNTLNNSILRYPFGRFTFQKLNPGTVFNYLRTQSIFHEPSYFGIICCLFIAIGLFINSSSISYSVKFHNSYFILLIIGVAISFSSAMYYALALIYIAYFLTNKDFKFNNIIMLFCFCILVFFILSFTGLSKIFNRISEVGKEGTSGFERIISPLQYIQKTMVEYPLFGRGMGQEGNVDRVGIIGTYMAVNNSVFGIVVIFGLSSVIFIVSALFAIIKTSKSNKRVFIIFAFLFAMYFSTGAFLSFDTYFIMIICLLSTNVSSAFGDSL